MKVMDILARDAVILDLGVESKREVLAEMASALAKVEPQIDADRLLEVLSLVADHTRLEMLKFEHDLEEGPTWNAGEVTGPGTLVCDSCNEVIRFHATGYIPNCPNCGHTVFHRKTVKDAL